MMARVRYIYYLFDLVLRHHCIQVSLQYQHKALLYHHLDNSFWCSDPLVYLEQEIVPQNLKERKKMFLTVVVFCLSYEFVYCDYINV